MATQTCNPAPGRVRQEDCEFEDSVGYIYNTHTLV